ncbi:MAG: SURF1 family protein [Nocardioides sp.]
MRTWLTPRLIGAHLLAIVCVGLAAGLGLWQHDAWQQSRAAEARDLTQLDPVLLDDVIGPDDPFPGLSVGQPVTVTGTWLPEATVLISDRDDAGTPGLWVVTPLTSGATTAPAIAIVRGWVPTAGEVPDPPEGTATVTGWLQPPEGSGVLDEEPTDDVYPQLRIADLVQRVPGDLYGAYVVAQQGVGGLEPADLAALPQVGRFTALRNLLYAIEWWFFGAFAAFIWWRFVRDEAEAQRHTNEGDNHGANHGADHGADRVANRGATGGADQQTDAQTDGDKPIGNLGV